MIDLVSYLPARRKPSASGWVSFNAPCCEHNGESRDRRNRGGIKMSDAGWSYHCFNCGYTASFILGRTLSFKSRKLMSWMGVPAEEIERINLESLRHRNMEGLLSDRQRVANQLQSIEFEDRDLPADTMPLSAAAQAYLQARAAPADYPFLYKTMPRPGVVIPYTYDRQVVGHATRFLDDRNPRYINDTPSGYVFGTDLQHADWRYVLVVEGVFDALCVSGLAVLHADINDAQARLIRSLDREVVVVPDQDTAGLRLVDRAVELGWSVSMPDWPADVKDVNDAVIRWGRVATVITIMQARETSPIKIELRKRQLVKRLRT